MMGRQRIPALVFGVITAAFLSFSLVYAAEVKPAAQAEWEQVVAKAKAEGVVTLAGPPGTAYRKGLVDEFQKDYPGIQVEYLGGFPVELEPRILAERRAGRFLWDAYVHGPPSPVFTLKPEGALEPILSALILPEVKDEKKWIRGFKPGMGVADKSPPFVSFMFDATTSSIFHVNRALVKKEELNSPQDLVKPGLKGKIVMDDPRREGPGVNALAILSANYGRDFVRRFLAEQEVVFTRDRRQIAEWIVRGRYPVAIAVGSQELTEFQNLGIGKEVERFVGTWPKVSSFSPGFGAVAMFTKAPHPHAARLYVNWLLSPRGQQAWVTAMKTRNSRRVDVAPGDPAMTIDEKSSYMVFQSEEGWPVRRDMEALAKEVYKEPYSR